MVEDDYMIIGLEDCIPIDHRWGTIADHTSEGDILGEVQLANPLPYDLRVSTCDELDDLRITD